MTQQTPAEIIEAVHGFSDALKAAYEALARIPYGQRAALDAYLDEKVYFGDLDHAARMITAMADDWTGELPGDAKSLPAPTQTQEAA